MRTFGRLTTVINNILSLDEGAIGVQIWRNKQVQNFVVKLNTLDQLFNEGIDAKGNVVGTYTAFTESINAGQSFSYMGKSKTKQEGDPYNFLQNGDFLKSFKVTQILGGYNVFANDIKADGTILTQKYGIDLLGLNESSNIKLVQALIPEMVGIIRKKILK